MRIRTQFTSWVNNTALKPKNSSCNISNKLSGYPTLNPMEKLMLAGVAWSELSRCSWLKLLRGIDNRYKLATLYISLSKGHREDLSLFRVYVDKEIFVNQYLIQSKDGQGAGRWSWLLRIWFSNINWLPSKCKCIMNKFHFRDCSMRVQIVILT